MKYQKHLRRISDISKKRSSSLAEHLGADLRKRRELNGYQAKLAKEQAEENDRLHRKLSDIGRRRGSLCPGTDQEHSRFLTINMQAREHRRLRQEKALQAENDQMVERIMQKMSGQHSFKDLLEGNSPPRLRSKNQSVVLPKLEDSLEM